MQLPEVNRLLKQFDQMQKTMKKLAKGGMLKNMMRGMGGRMPPGIRSLAGPGRRLQSFRGAQLSSFGLFCCPEALFFITISG